MKKIGIVSFLLVSMIFALSGCVKINKIGTEKYYVKIVKGGEREKSNSNDGKISYYYTYTNIQAYDKEGKKILVNINTIEDKEIRKDAYLQVDVKNPSDKETNEIKGYEEVKQSEIPEKAKKELN
ncbi:YxeA family protein [Eubacterium multiforme]|uniref:Uncharacterized protein (TIGR01655 family) n=1 Tax=Eubacterium multiforme TaxID=83339 RepID=A0ABT9UTJ6_9FIRM|nr:YxeA family protein [Eubacterium multiforme]MDQ0149619.1 uncharacterized protein (TIGR01655 family) [Eubacterium multiforme]